MKKQGLVFAIMIMAVALVMAGCGQQKKFDPVPIQEGVDICEVCKMMITDDHTATQLILNSGKALKFDDIGDLFVWTEKNGLEDVNVRYVRDFHTEDWIELEKAYYAYDSSYKTPMGFGVYSFKNKQDAEAYIAEQNTGILLTAKELESHDWESSMDHGDHGHGEHGHGHSDGEHGEHDSHADDEHAEHGETDDGIHSDGHDTHADDEHSSEQDDNK